MSARCLPLDDRNGRPVVVVVAKMTYLVSPVGEATVASPQVEARLADEMNDSAGPRPSIRYPSDAVADKPGTDVIFVGTAYPPLQGPGVTELHVSVRVGHLQKSLRVTGPRTFQVSVLGAVAPGPPAPLTPTPIVYELARGGYDDSDPARLVMDPTNWSGTGVARSPELLVGRRAPQIECGRAAPGGRSTPPAGFGVIAPEWSPRRELAGTYDAAWRRDRAPFRPRDFDPHHDACAHPDLHSPTPLLGDEPVEVLGATPEGVWRFRLPRYAPSFHTTELARDATARAPARVSLEHATHLDTFLVDGDRRAVELTWRASIPLPKKIDRLESIRIYAAPELPDPMLRELAERTAFAASEPSP
ncbi:MAG: DUF2169 domain-containing protein [Polyangiaceae bacterium]|nr:DUF2169 domain-containing protein [Polyangiaceae bacterium]